MFPSGGKEGLEVLLHDAVENGVLRLAPLVLGRIGHAARSAEVVGHGWEPLRGACLGWQASCAREKVPEGPGVTVRSRSPVEWVFTALPIGRDGPAGRGGGERRQPPLPVRRARRLCRGRPVLWRLPAG